MNPFFHKFSELFAQLGLPSNVEGIREFIGTHSPLSPDFALPDASFWSVAQAAFLREALQDDSDWAEIADQLNQALRNASDTSP